MEPITLKPKHKPIFEYNNSLYYCKDLVGALNHVGVKNGDSIFVHSDLRHFGRINTSIKREEFLGAFVGALKETVGENGNIIMPTFSYSFCRGEVFDSRLTTSKVGALTEYFRNTTGVKRSEDPIFSVAVFGPNKNYFTNVGNDCFGKGSIFEKLYKRNSKIVFLGETFDITFMHFAEQHCRVPYRYIKKFSGKIRAGGREKPATYYYYVRSLDGSAEYDLDKVVDYFQDCGILNKVELGHSIIRMIEVRKAFHAICDGLKNDIGLLLRNVSKV